ncbi:MAG TPA: S41 family peptidase, partial [Bacteroidota bacterium]|nr:S41 family peptidase [Bacteroidota bacterium]
GTRMNAGKVVRTVALTGVVVALVVGFAGFISSPESDYFLKINKSIDVFGRVYKEITANYVDEVDPEKFMQAGIDGMLGTLDPYTTYIDQENGDEVDLLTNGKYGGIGVTIGQRDGAIQVITVMDGYSAQRAGIVPGDRILEVDGIAIGSKKPDEVRSLTRGEPGSETKVLVGREGEKEPIQFVLIREEIQVKNVTYADLLDGGIAYIRLERFSRRAGDEVRQAIAEIKLKGEIKGVVLDVRGNPGGLLDAAVDVVSKFVQRGSPVVSTKGRRIEADKQYSSQEEPLLPGTPLVVLTDRNSASASEIVAGALQDLDRGLIVGTRTFGKGLVQTIQPLNYGAQLKITTARYYIPSGRSIQEIDYMHKDRNGVFLTVPDSLKREFKTVRGRKVYELGGIAPDSVVKEEEIGPMIRELYRKSLFFKFANKYMADHRKEDFTGITDGVLVSFREFLEAEKFDYQEESDGKVKELRQIAERSHYSKEVLADLDLLVSALEKEKVRGFDRYKNHIGHELNIELMARAKGEQGRIAASLTNDDQLAAAIGILKTPVVYALKLKH